jgi:hypothetical protein
MKFQIKTIIVDLTKENDYHHYTTTTTTSTTNATATTTAKRKTNKKINRDTHLENQKQLITQITNLVNYYGATPALPIILSSSSPSSSSTTSSSQLSGVVPSSQTKGRKKRHKRGLLKRQPYTKQKETKETKTTIVLLTKSIIRFIQPKDKITQFTSTLLKSWLYHFYNDYYCTTTTTTTTTTTNDGDDGDDGDNDDDNDTTSNDIKSIIHPIVVLPRTQAKKPYIHLHFQYYQLARPRTGLRET